MCIICNRITREDTSIELVGYMFYLIILQDERRIDGSIRVRRLYVVEAKPLLYLNQRSVNSIFYFCGSNLYTYAYQNLLLQQYIYNTKILQKNKFINCSTLLRLLLCIPNNFILEIHEDNCCIFKKFRTV